MSLRFLECKQVTKKKNMKDQNNRNNILQMDVTQGTMTASRDRNPNGQAALKKGQTMWADSWIVDFQCQQHGIIRYNCADSLDRTNAASYFGAVQVIRYHSHNVPLSAYFELWKICIRMTESIQSLLTIMLHRMCKRIAWYWKSLCMQINGWLYNSSTSLVHIINQQLMKLIINFW